MVLSCMWQVDQVMDNLRQLPTLLRRSMDRHDAKVRELSWMLPNKILETDLPIQQDVVLSDKSPKT